MPGQSMGGRMKWLEVCTCYWAPTNPGIYRWNSLVSMKQALSSIEPRFACVVSMGVYIVPRLAVSC